MTHETTAGAKHDYRRMLESAVATRNDDIRYSSYSDNHRVSIIFVSAIALLAAIAPPAPVGIAGSTGIVNQFSFP